MIFFKKIVWTVMIYLIPILNMYNGKLCLEYVRFLLFELIELRVKNYLRIYRMKVKNFKLINSVRNCWIYIRYLIDKREMGGRKFVEIIRERIIQCAHSLSLSHLFRKRSISVVVGIFVFLYAFEQNVKLVLLVQRKTQFMWLVSKV